MSIIYPYIIFGRVRKNGQAQANLTVKIKNVTKNEECTTTTNSNGEYGVSLADKTKFPSQYSDGDQIEVTIVEWNVKASTTVDKTNYPDKREVSFELWEISDQGVGAEALSLQAMIGVEDSASGADEVEPPTASIGVSDSGAGQESIGQAATLSLEDSAVASETVTFQASITIADVGAGAETVEPPEASIAVSDVGSGVETIDLHVPLQASDSGNGQDQTEVTVPVDVQDQGVAVENVEPPEAHIPVEDSAQSIEQLILTADLGVVSDSGSSSELVAVSAPSMIEIADLGQGSDSAEAEVPINISDQGTGSEQVLDPTVEVEIQESGVASENIELQYSTVISDEGSGLDLITVEIGVVYVNVADQGFAIETVGVNVNLAVTDQGVTVEVVSVIKPKPPGFYGILSLETLNSDFKIESIKSTLTFESLRSELQIEEEKE